MQSPPDTTASPDEAAHASDAQFGPPRFEFDTVTTRAIALALQSEIGRAHV